MASLTGTKIKDTYPGLLKTVDNAIVGATEKQITDGEGNAIPISMGTSGVSFTGAADFTAATVTGLSEAGLVSGTGTDSMQSDASLTTTAANASGACAIALGNSTIACNNSIALGPNAIAGDTSFSLRSNIAIGRNACTIFESIAIGDNACSNNAATIALGTLTQASDNFSIAIGRCAIATNGAVALGADVTAAKADTVTVKEIETCVAGGGLILTTPDGLNQPKLTVNDSQELLIGGNPVGGGGAAGLVSGTGADSMQSDASLTTAAADASGPDSIALGDGAIASAQCAIAIGTNTQTDSSFYGISIGHDTRAGNSTIAIGNCANKQAGFVVHAMVFGNTANAQNCGVAISRLACASTAAVAIGNQSNALSGCSVAIGNTACVSAAATNAVALGAGVNAAKADTVTVKELETCVAGGGLILTTPDGLNQPKLTVNDSQELLIGGNPVGGGGAAGLVSGTGADSMQSAASLTTVASTASGNCSVALGNNSCATTNFSVALGGNALACGIASYALGGQATGGLSLSVGFGSISRGCRSVAIGNSSDACADNSIAILGNAASTSTDSISIGYNSYNFGICSLAIGRSAGNNTAESVALGAATFNSCDTSTAVGRGARTANNDSTAIGASTCATAIGAVALGANVCATKADTVTVKSLETCVAGEGVIMTTPDGTAQYKITVDNAGALVSTLVV